MEAAALAAMLLGGVNNQRLLFSLAGSFLWYDADPVDVSKLPLPMDMLLLEVVRVAETEAETEVAVLSEVKMERFDVLTKEHVTLEVSDQLADAFNSLNGKSDEEDTEFSVGGCKW